MNIRKIVKALGKTLLFLALATGISIGIKFLVNGLGTVIGEFNAVLVTISLLVFFLFLTYLE